MFAVSREAVMNEYNLRRHHETSKKHTDKDKNMDTEQRLQKVEELKRGLKSQQAPFTKAKSQSEAAVKASFIVAEEVAKSARPFTEGESIKNCMLKVCDAVCPDKRQLFSNMSLSRNTVAERIDQLSTNLEEQLVGKEKISSHIPLMWMRAPTHLTLPSCQFSFVEWTPA